jgi:hypothetical protein
MEIYMVEAGQVEQGALVELVGKGIMILLPRSMKVQPMLTLLPPILMQGPVIIGGAFNLQLSG